MKFFIYRKIYLSALFSFLIFLISSSHIAAANVGDMTNFYVDKDFDSSASSQLSATLIKATNSLYFYVDSQWWNSQSQQKQTSILGSLDSLSNEFDQKIYPVLTSFFGTEEKPGIDNDNKITVLFEKMNSNEGGYFRESDEYDKLELSSSNMREMVYLSLDQIQSVQAKEVLAHELVHLITFNQKNKIYGSEEDTWLNEARADYSSSILGYDDQYAGSNLQQRVNDFTANPSDSVTEWLGTKYDYASVSLFTHYLVEHYGIGILSDSLKSKYIGITSINYALQLKGYKEDFGKIFSDWAIASIINDCSVDKRYCYLETSLASMHVSPLINFLPVTGNVSLTVSNVTKNWAGNWLKIIGGNGDLKLGFNSLRGLNFKVPYIIEDSAGSYAVQFLTLDKDEKGEIDLAKFGTDYKSLILIPSLQTKTSDFDFPDSDYPYTYSIFINGSKPAEDQSQIQHLLDQIDYLKSQIALLQNQKNGSLNQSCSSIYINLQLGMSGSQVGCLQIFLKSQGSSIYPEGLITGNFGNLTKSAVIKFQEKYSSDILVPFGITKGTGYVGQATRNKINQILSKNIST